MRKEDGLSIISLIIIIVLLIVLAGFAINKIFGRDGVVDQFKEVDNEYNKTEIVDNLNLVVKEKYVLDSKYALENNLKIEDICNSDILFAYLIENKYIEQLKDINDNIVADQYYINPNSFKGELANNVINENGSNSNGTKVYKIKKINDKYMIYFVDKYGDEQELGELNLKPEV